MSTSDVQLFLALAALALLLTLLGLYRTVRAARRAEDECFRCAGHGLTYEPLRECVYQQGRAWKRARLCFDCAVAREAMPVDAALRSKNVRSAFP